MDKKVLYYDGEDFSLSKLGYFQREEYLFSDYRLKQVGVGDVVRVLVGLWELLNSINFDNPNPPLTREEINEVLEARMKESEHDSTQGNTDK